MADRTARIAVAAALIGFPSDPSAAVLAALGIDPDTPLPLRIITQVDDGDFRMTVCEVIDNAIYNLIDDEDSRIAKRIIPALAKAGLLAARLEEQ